MRLRITGIIFSTKHDWLFNLSNENDNEFFIMHESFYENNNFKSPLTKKEKDYYNKGNGLPH